MNLVFRYYASPVGWLKLVASTAGLVAVLWPKDDPQRVPLQSAIEGDSKGILAETEQQLHEYFTCSRQQFDLPLDLRGTPFQQQVWRALCAIPYGETTSYGQLARQLGSPAATRAVGAANGRNPISIIVPCHRVIGATGKLTGFAGGMLAKQYLLHLESMSLFREPAASLHVPSAAEKVLSSETAQAAKL